MYCNNVNFNYIIYMWVNKIAKEGENEKYKKIQYIFRRVLRKRKYYIICENLCQTFIFRERPRRVDFLRKPSGNVRALHPNKRNGQFFTFKLMQVIYFHFSYKMPYGSRGFRKNHKKLRFLISAFVFSTKICFQ